MGMPWPAGLAVALAPLGAGTLAVRHWATTGPLGIDGFWMVAGILSFFVLLDALVGLGGRYDLTLGAILTALALARLRRRFPHAHPRRRRPALLPGRARVAPPPGMNGRGEDLDRRRIDWEKRLQL
jgi:hypothetical protein